MPELIEEQRKELLAIELGGLDDPLFIRVLNLRWNQFMDQDGVDPRLRELFVKRSLLDYLISKNRERVNWKASTGTSQNDSDIVKNLESARDDVIENIQMIQGAQAPQIGQLTAVEPITPDDPILVTIPTDPSDRMYRGDPLRRSI